MKDVTCVDETYICRKLSLSQPHISPIVAGGLSDTDEDPRILQIIRREDPPPE